MRQIWVAVQGVMGKMGQEVFNALCREPGLEVVAGIEREVLTRELPLPDGSGTVPFSSDLGAVIDQCHPDVVVDFTVAEATMPAVRLATRKGVNLVIGTTGLSQDNLNEIESLSGAYDVGVVVAPNFALGAVLMIHLAKLAARFLDYAEIIELHHERKVDAPSGTALSTARAMLAARGRPFAEPQGPSDAVSRGEQGEGVAIHSVRLPGLLAHQKVILGAAGQTLTIRHDTISRECYMPGVILAVKEVVKRKGLVYGLDALLGLQEGR